MSFAAADIADWFDEKRKKRERDLEEWVVDNPQWWNVALATIGATSMEFLGGYVDVLRLGEGAAEGGWRGYGKDALRAISIIPIGRIVLLRGPALRARLLPQSLQVAARVKGVTGPCTFQAVNNAMQIVRGKSLFVTVRKIAEALGKPIGAFAKNAQGKLIAAAWVDDLVNVIRANGGRVKLVQGLKKIEEVVELARREGSPVIFAFETVVKEAGKERVIKHSVIAIRDLTGRVKFADYGGKLFTTLDELIARWGTRVKPIELLQKAGGASAAAIGGTVEALGEFARRLQQGAALVLTGMNAIETEDGVDIAFEAAPVAINAPAQSDEASVEVVKESFENFVRRKAGEPLSTTKPPKAPIMMDPVHITGRPRPTLVMDPIEIKGAFTHRDRTG
jgi:hypothetical protein